jgi:hypothetical protein
MPEQDRSAAGVFRKHAIDRVQDLDGAIRDVCEIPDGSTHNIEL